MVVDRRHPRRARQTRRSANGPGMADAVAALLAGNEPRGWTADELVETLGLPIDGAALQRQLETMVARRRLDRHGVGRGALYTLLGRPHPADGTVTGA